MKYAVILLKDLNVLFDNEPTYDAEKETLEKTRTLRQYI